MSSSFENQVGAEEIWGLQPKESFAIFTLI